MKRSTLLVGGISALLLIAGLVFAKIVSGHIPIPHDHSISICWGYAQGRAFGKQSGDPECDPRTTNADRIYENYFPFVSDQSLSGIQVGDIVVFGQVRGGLSSHAAYVVEIPSPFSIDNIKVDQVPSQGGPEQTGVLLSVVKQSQGNPVGYHRGSGGEQRVILTFQNSFGSGDIRVGKDKSGNWITVPSGTSRTYLVGSTLDIEAIDGQSFGGYVRRFSSWTGPNIPNPASISTSISVPSSDATYTAHFRREFNITFQNNLRGASGGQIKVNGSTYSAPYVAHTREQTPPQGITGEAIYQVVSGIQYTFSQWGDGITTNPRTFTPTDHATYTAHFNAKPLPPPNVSAGGPVGSPVQITWSEHPSTNVTQYQIWRRARQQGTGQTGPPQLLATVSRGTLSYTDHEFLVTEYYTHDMLWYDVRSVFTAGGTTSYSDPPGL